MPIPRGTIWHGIGEDFINSFNCILNPSQITQKASYTEKNKLKKLITKNFNTKYACLFPYARSAFYHILKALNLPKRSEILLTPITIGPMLEVIRFLGHKPVFVDIESKTFCVDENDLKKKLKRRPALFLMTYLFGYIPNVKRIVSLCKNSDTLLIEDISHNIGGKIENFSLGTFGYAGIYSASMFKYVDGYNGAFVITNSSGLMKLLEKQIKNFQPPNSKRVCGIILKTFFWNLSLRRIPFNLVTFPTLWVLKKFYPPKFNQIVGPKIKLENLKKPPKYYFEDISSIQCRTIYKHLLKLRPFLSFRKKMAEMVLNEYKKILNLKNNSSSRSTFWQFVVPVKNLVLTKDALFLAGVETGGTNLMNLGAFLGKKLKGAISIKENHIYIPMHSWLKIKKYRKIFNLIYSEKYK